jgi:glutathione S-transferase
MELPTNSTQKMPVLRTSDLGKVFDALKILRILKLGANQCLD